MKIQKIMLFGLVIGCIAKLVSFGNGKQPKTILQCYFIMKLLQPCYNKLHVAAHLFERKFQLQKHFISSKPAVSWY
jgi:hypothetical protein